MTIDTAPSGAMDASDFPVAHRGGPGPWWTTLEEPLAAVTVRHLALLSARQLLESANAIGSNSPGAVSPSELGGAIEQARKAVAGHRADLTGEEGLSGLIGQEAPWLVLRLQRLLARHSELERTLAMVLEKLESWPPSGVESYSSQVVRGEFRIAAALLDQVLTEEFLLEGSFFDSPPALD